MADEEALAILRSGVPAWNVWQSTVPDTSFPNLAGANLGGTKIARANLACQEFCVWGIT